MPKQAALFEQPVSFLGFPSSKRLNVTLPAGALVPSTQNLAFLGLGQMGAPIARLLLTQGHNVTLWNRDRSKADAIPGGSSHVAASPQDAVRDAAIVFTMLADDVATEAVLFGNAHQPGF